MTHHLKIYPQFYEPVAQGLKTFEIRKNDRGFNAGDTVILAEYDPSIMTAAWLTVPTPIGYTRAEPLEFTIGYVLPVDAERVVFSLLKPKDKLNV